MSGEEMDWTPSQLTIEWLHIMRRAHRGVVMRLPKKSMIFCWRNHCQVGQLIDWMLFCNNWIINACSTRYKSQDIDTMYSSRNRMGDRRFRSSRHEILKYKRKMKQALHSVASSSCSKTVETGEPVAALPIGGRSQVGKTRLPNLVLTKFHRNVTNWTSFGNVFKAAIHENNDISKTD